MKDLLKEGTALKCESCGHDVFIPAFKFVQISRFVTGEDQDTLIPVNVFACNKCGHVNKDFIPEELQSKETLLLS